MSGLEAQERTAYIKKAFYKRRAWILRVLSAKTSISLVACLKYDLYTEDARTE